MISKMVYTKAANERLTLSCGLARKESYLLGCFPSLIKDLQKEGAESKMCFLLCFELPKCVIFRKHSIFSTSTLRLTAVEG